MRALSDDSKKKIIDVPYVNQLDVVFGCEAVSAAMVLLFYGSGLSWRDFTDSHLIKREWRIDNGVIYGPVHGRHIRVILTKIPASTAGLDVTLLVWRSR